MRFELLEADKPIDAQYELSDDGREVVVHSRGGSKNTPDARNPQYKEGLQALLERLQDCSVSFSGVWVDSKEVQGQASSARQILFDGEGSADAREIYELLTRRMPAIGQQPGAKGGNSTRRLLIKLKDKISFEEISARAVNLPHEDLAKINAVHLYTAVYRLLAGETHPFGASIDYDVVVEGIRLPPKAVFGLAATQALGFRVTPYHFKAGIGSPCFAALLEAGYPILPKGVNTPKHPPDPDQDWSEGSEQVLTHLRRERAPGLAKAKKAAFKAEHGRLYCEKCRTDLAVVTPVSAREAAFEVHHSKISVADMPKGHKTKLEDLECLCANCHRIVHWHLRQAMTVRSPTT